MNLKRVRFSYLIPFALVLFTCQPVGAVQSPAIRTPLPSARTAVLVPAAPSAASRGAANTARLSGAVRACDYAPGRSLPAQIPPQSFARVRNRRAVSLTFGPGTADPAALSLQSAVFNQLTRAINERYFSADYNGADWRAIQGKYRDLVQKGLKQADFYQAMSQMVAELGDGVSVYVGLSGPVRQARVFNELINIGGAYSTVNNAGEDIPVLTWVFPGSPAGLVGLKSHDLLLKVDGLPFLDEHGRPRPLGAEGAAVTLTVQTPGQSPREVKLVRRSFEPAPVVDGCLVAGTHTGYIRWLDLDSPSMIDQTTQVLEKMSSPGPLQGLIVDLRMSQGSFLSNLEWLMGLFTRGELGRYVSLRGDSPPIKFMANPPPELAAFQELPLVVLQDQDTATAALTSGLLQLIGRARIAGQTAPGASYSMYIEGFQDGSVLLLANEVFQPAGKAPDDWRKNWVVPDVMVAGSWDQFTEENDPYLASAVELLNQK